MNDLDQLFREATDHVRSPDLVGGALASAHRRRVRRTAVGALAAVVLMGGGAAWVLQDPTLRAGVVDTPEPTPSPTATPSAVGTDEAKMGTQPLWDPFTVVDSPRGPTVLPEVLAPPADAPSVLDAAIPAAVVAWPEEDRPIMLLSPLGDWRSIPGTESIAPSSLRDVASPAISSDGRLVTFAAEAGLWVVDVVAGEQRLLPWPEQVAEAWDTPPGVRWMPGDEAVLVMHWNTPWVMGLDGSDVSAAYLGQYAGGIAIDPDGPLLERRFRTGTLVEWRDGEVVRRVDDGGIAWGERAVAGSGLFAITGGLGGGAFAGPIVIDATTGARVAYAPIRDEDSDYSDNGHLTAMGFLDEETVLLLVTPMDFRTMQAGDARTHLVVWDFTTGDFELLASGGPGMRSIAVAPDLLDD